ncbi:F0F1 ATP synthase subunit B family protein [Streptomyces sp. NPDC002845]
MDLIPYPLGPLNPRAEHLAVAAGLFALAFFAVSRLLPRLHRALAEREDAIKGAAERARSVREEAESRRADAEALLAEARHDAARIRQRAFEEGAALIAAAREEGQRERDAVLAEGRARIDSESAMAEAELRVHVSELASSLASRVVGERIATPAEPRS